MPGHGGEEVGLQDVGVELPEFVLEHEQSGLLNSGAQSPKQGTDYSGNPFDAQDRSAVTRAADQQSLSKIQLWCKRNPVLRWGLLALGAGVSIGIGLGLALNRSDNSPGNGLVPTPTPKPAPSSGNLFRCYQGMVVNTTDLSDARSTVIGWGTKYDLCVGNTTATPNEVVSNVLYNGTTVIGTQQFTKSSNGQVFGLIINQPCAVPGENPVSLYLEDITSINGKIDTHISFSNAVNVHLKTYLHTSYIPAGSDPFIPGGSFSVYTFITPVDCIVTPEQAHELQSLGRSVVGMQHQRLIDEGKDPSAPEHRVVEHFENVEEAIAKLQAKQQELMQEQPRGMFARFTRQLLDGPSSFYDYVSGRKPSGNAIGLA